ncbi:MAG TPA: hypothetical protein VEB18_01040 [Candidatus Paceibacterota bacterium]|nr:hypothetical protein [Candidatus Paceibacterota bacterium]
MRKILIIGGVVVALLLIGAAIYFLFFAGKGPAVTTETPGNLFGSSNEAGTINEAELPPLGEASGNAGEQIAPNLTKITDGPVAVGVAVFLVREVGSTTPTIDTEIRYIERQSGHIYSYRLGARTLTRLTNRTLPGVMEARWLSDGSRTYARFLAEGDAGELHVETFALPVVGDDGYFLESDLSDVAVTGTSTLLTLLPNANGSVATVTRPDGSSPRTLFTSLLSSLRILPAGPGYVAYTKASAQANGYGFLIGGTSGVFERVLGPLRGLTMLPSPSGSYILYSYLSGSVVRTEMLDVSTRISTVIPLGTLPEKCVWAPNEQSVYCAAPRSFSGTTPDDWYQGVISYSDRIWKIDLESRLALLVVDPSTVGQVDIDAVGLTIDPNATALTFTNRKDGSLWVYEL